MITRNNTISLNATEHFRRSTMPLNERFMASHHAAYHAY